MDSVIAFFKQVDWGVITTLGLLAVTAWYALTTKQMAETAKEAAGESAKATMAAERSAHAAMVAAQVAMAQIQVEFKGRIIPVEHDGTHVATVEIMSTGNTVFVHGVRCERAFRQASNGLLPDEAELEGVDLQSLFVKLPFRLHPGERLHFSHPDMQTGTSPLTRYILQVAYGFSAEGDPVGTKECIVNLGMEWGPLPGPARRTIRGVADQAE